MQLLSGQWYGDTMNKHCIEGLILSETSYNSNLKLPRHSHEQSYFCFVLKGVYTESCRKTEKICTKSMLIYHPADETHSDHFRANSRCFNIQMDKLWMERLKQHSISLNESVHFQSGVLPLLAMRLYDEFCKADTLSSLIVEGLALEIVGEVGRKRFENMNRVPPRWLVEARDLLHERFAEHLPLRQQARYVGVHPVHLAREFRRFYHCTTGEYVRRLRIEAACERLIHSDKPISEIALASGFFDQSHFTRTFKQFTTKTPHEYRALFLKR